MSDEIWEGDGIRARLEAAEAALTLLNRADRPFRDGLQAFQDWMKWADQSAVADLGAALDEVDWLVHVILCTVQRVAAGDRAAWLADNRAKREEAGPV